VLEYNHSGRAGGRVNKMNEVGKQWEGQIVNGEFPLQRYLGASNHSAVFLTELGGAKSRRAAIKLIPVDSEGTEIQLARLKAAAKLSHPHLLKIHQTGSCELRDTKLLYIVLEYADEDLSQVLPTRALTQAEGLDMIPPILDALSYLHRQGFVHTRLRPRNIVAVHERLKLSSDSIREEGGVTAGPSKASVYDAPEMARGLVSPAADVWSLGVTLVEALTQRLPVWDGAGSGDPLLPGTLPEPFRDIAFHCLRREPTQRWTLGDIAARLKSGASNSAKQATATVTEASSKSRLTTPVMVVALSLVLVLAIWGLFRHGGGTQPNAPAAAEQPTTNPKPEPGTPVETGTPNPSSRTTKSLNRKPLATTAEPATPAGAAAHDEVLQQVLPDVSKTARNTIQGTVKVSVRVTVDSSGKVANATFESPGPSKYFARKAMEAAQQWKFKPVQNNRQPVPNEWILRFQFKRSGTSVIPSPAAH
jgi:TonB family protein